MSFFYFFIRCILYLYVFYIYIYICLQLCIIYVSGVSGGQRRVLDPLELELWTVVNHYVNA